MHAQHTGPGADCVGAFLVLHGLHGAVGEISRKDYFRINLQFGGDRVRMHRCAESPVHRVNRFFVVALNLPRDCVNNLTLHGVAPCLRLYLRWYGIQQSLKRSDQWGASRSGRSAFLVAGLSQALYC